MGNAEPSRHGSIAACRNVSPPTTDTNASPAMNWASGLKLMKLNGVVCFSPRSSQFDYYR